MNHLSRNRVLLLCNYSITFGFGLFAPLYAVFAMTVGAGLKDVGLLFASFSITIALSTLIFGRIGNGVRDKTALVIVAYAVMGLTSIGFMLVSSRAELFIVQTLYALGYGLMLPFWKTAYAESAPAGGEGKSWAAFDGGNQILNALSAAISGILVAATSFYVLFGIMAVMHLMASLLSLRLWRKRRKLRRIHGVTGAASLSPAPAAE